MSAFLWVVLAVLYFALFFFLGMATYRNRHYVMFWLGIFFPILWIFGALMTPPASVGPTAAR